MEVPKNGVGNIAQYSTSNVPFPAFFSTDIHFFHTVRHVYMTSLWRCARTFCVWLWNSRKICTCLISRSAFLHILVAIIYNLLLLFAMDVQLKDKWCQGSEVFGKRNFVVTRLNLAGFDSSYCVTRNRIIYIHCLHVMENLWNGFKMYKNIIKCFQKLNLLVWRWFLVFLWGLGDSAEMHRKTCYFCFEMRVLENEKNEKIN